MNVYQDGFWEERSDQGGKRIIPQDGHRIPSRVANTGRYSKLICDIPNIALPVGVSLSLQKTISELEKKGPRSGDRTRTISR